MTESKKVPCPGRVFDDGTIIEQCWNGKEAYYYVWLPPFGEGHATFDRRNDYALDSHKEMVLVPASDEILAKNCVVLAREPLDYGTELELFEEVQRYIKKYVDLDEIFVKIIALYVLLTWVFDKCPAVPLISIRGGSESGKSRLGEVMKELCYRCLRASGSLTFSSLFHNRELWGGALYINEGDLKKSSEESKIVRYLNESYEKGGVVWLTNPTTYKQEVYRSFGPVIIVTRKGFDDDALESRCFVVVMRETTRKDIPANLPPSFYGESLILRNRLLMFRFKNHQRFENDYALRFDGVGSRLNQILQPMASLARGISESLFSELKALAADFQERLVRDRAESEDGMIVRAYFRLLGTKEDIIATDLETEIAEMGGTITANMIGRRMASLPFKKYATKDGRKRPYKVEETQTDLLLRKYVPRDEREEIERRIEQSRLSDGSDRFDRTVARPSLAERAEKVRSMVKEGVKIQKIVDEDPSLEQVVRRMLQTGEIGEDPDGRPFLP